MSCRILICDDSNDDSALLLHSLLTAGVTVDCTRARDGDEALDFLMTTPEFDLVVLDHRLPRKSGLDVVEILHGHGRFPSCPVIVLTSHLGNEQQRLSALGVQAVLEKPFSLEGYLNVGEFLAGFCRLAARQH